jgi:putative copper resistance protein D
MYLSLATIRFFESLPSAFAVGLLIMPLLIGENSKRFKSTIAIFATCRALLGFVLLYLILRQIIPIDRSISFGQLIEFTLSTTVGWAWIVSELLAFLFAGLTLLRLTKTSRALDFASLMSGLLLLSVVAVTGHAIDDGLPKWAQLSFFLHTTAGLSWLGGLLGLIW